jgi:dTDP-4-dehydrorhamnose 3,5-epimerase-like enzyme
MSADDVGHNAVGLAAKSKVAQIHLGDGVTKAADGTGLPGVVGIGVRVEPGAVLGESVPTGAIEAGNPAVINYPDAERRIRARRPERTAGVRPSAVRGVSAHNLRAYSDPTGWLSVAEFEQEIPFRPRRYFVIFDVPSEEARGAHAHKTCEQLLIAVHGKVSVVVDDGTASEEYLLDRPTLGLYVPPMIWAIEYRYSSDAVLVVFASHHYDPADYIRDYGEFRAALNGHRSRSPNGD